MLFGIDLKTTDGFYRVIVSSQSVKKERKNRKNRCEKLSEKRWKPIDLHPSFAGSLIMTLLGLSETLSNWPYLTLVLYLFPFKVISIKINDFFEVLLYSAHLKPVCFFGLLCNRVFVFLFLL